MYQRKVIYLQEMFNDVSSEEEKLKVQQLYQQGNKGSAVVYMVKRVKRQWDAMLGKNSDVEPLVKPRTIKINEGGTSHVVVAR